ncbi:hypothetical protein AV530_004523 [Patagioenas fasciata monilis]|uniref:Uncharacterized protein n=1 Tax=Patagioenas fasciata monilis TaxID=372326 RepID=A0A1V4J5Y4_PATFA|nr:hypothetical protein AV530_004523 [Patagioenas fasciata monilis]
MLQGGAEFVLSGKKSSKKLTSGGTSASVRKKSEAEDSSPPKQKTYRMADKDLHRNSSAGPFAGGRQQTKGFYLKRILRRGRKQWNDLFILSFKNCLEKVQSMVEVTA